MNDDSVLDVGGVLRLLSRRRKWIYGSVVLFTALAAAVCLIMTPRYKATATLELLKQEEGALAPTGVGSTEGTGDQAEDALNFNLSLQTQVSVLESDELALRVIRELHLVGTEDYNYNPWIKTREVRRAMSLPIDQSPLKRAYVMKRWSRRLKVEAVSGTREITVSFSNPDPTMASLVVNRLLADYVEYRYNVRYQAALRSAAWLQSRLAALKSDVEESENHLVEVQKNTGVYGPDQGHDIVIARLEQLNAEAAVAESNRAGKEAIYKLAKTGDPELIAGLMSGTNQEGGAMGGTSPTLLISLRQQEAELSEEVAEASGKYGAANPKLRELQLKLNSARAEINSEIQRIAGRARQDYMAAVAAEQAANEALEDQKRVAAVDDEQSVAVGIAKHEADSAQEVYQQLLEQARETPILAGVRSTEVNIVDSAAPPGLPSSPIWSLYLALGAFAGMMIGVVAAFVRDSIDTTLRNPEDIEATTQLPVLGIIPRSKTLPKRPRREPHRRSSGLAVNVLFPHVDPPTPSLQGSLSASTSEVMEAFRSVRTSILLSRPDNPRKVFMVTSPLPGEGKSFSSLHLATALAQNGSSVLLVDADLRRGTLSRNLRMSSSTGLSTLLSGGSGERVCRLVEEVPGLSFLAAGLAPPNPAESLGSKKMAQLIQNWRNEYDFVVIDSPPILVVTDATVLSAITDGVVVVVRFALSTRQSITRATRLLVDVGAECFGVLVNGMDVRSSDYQYYSGGYGGESYYGKLSNGAAGAGSLSTAVSEEGL